MQEDNIISLDRINTLRQYDLQKLCDDGHTIDEPNDCPFNLINNTCLYYEPIQIRDIMQNERNNFSMFCLNCQGLRAHWDAFCGLIHDMGSGIEVLDVIGVTEIFSMENDACSLPGYHPIEFKTRNDTNNSKGGVGIFLRDCYNYNKRMDLSIFIPHIFESVFIEIKHNRKNIIIGTVYRPNTFPKADLDIFGQTMNDLLELLAGENKEIYIMGDMNIDLLKLNEHWKTGEYVENIFTHGFIPLITKPTRITDHSATLIDHIYTNRTDTNMTSGIITTDISDHFGIFTCFGRARNNNTHIETDTKSRTYSNTNMATFNKLLETVDFSRVLQENSPDIAYEEFRKSYLDAHDIAFPLKHRKIPKKFIKRSPWITNGLIQSSITKGKLLSKKLKSPTNVNTITYKRYSILYNKLLRTAKANYYQTELQLAKHDMKRTWKLIKCAMNKSDNYKTIPEYVFP